MRHYLVFILSLVFITFSNAQKLTHRLGEIIVEVADERQLNTLVGKMNSSYRSAGIKVEKLAEEPMLTYLIKFDPSTTDENELLREVTMSRYTLSAQKNHLIEYRLKPNDAEYEDQWQYFNFADTDKDLDIEEAWDIATGGVTANGDTIVVAVIDGGVAYDHEDLAENMWVNRAEIPGNGIDDDNNGYVDDYLGWSAVSEDDVINNTTYHGTQVSGIVGAKGNNEIGVSGISWDVKVMFIQGGGDEAEVLKAYAYPYSMRKRYNESNGEEGAFVVATNSSWGTDYGKAEDAPLWCDFYNMMGEEGILSCGATANIDINVEEEGDLPTTCSSDYLISVTNIKRNDAKAVAGFGKFSIDLGAYGAETYTVNSIGYGAFGGTSGATPHVAGTVALLYSTECSYLSDMSKSNPGKAALSVKDYILNGVVEIDDLKGRTTTGGKLNVYNSMLLATSSCEESCAPIYGVENKHSGIYAEEFSFIATDSTLAAVRYRKVGDEDWVYEDGIVAPYLLDELEFCTNYEVQFGTVCDTVNFQYSRYIQTDGCCEIPSIEGHNEQDGAYSIFWTTGAITDEVTVEYKVQDGTWQSEKVAGGNQYTFPVSLEDCSFIEARIKGYCGLTDVTTSLGDTYYIYSDCGSCQEDYCEFDNLDNTSEYLSKLEIENIFTRISTQADNGYEFVLDEDIFFTDNNAYTVNAEVTYSGSDYAENLAIFLDLNYDGIYQAEERLLYKEGFQASTSASFEIPELESFGSTRMRVILLFDPISGGCKSSDQRFGEVEDYCVEIRSHLSCPTYADLIMDEGVYDEEKGWHVITTADEFSTTFTVDVNGVADDYGVEIRREGETEFVTHNSGETKVSSPIQRCDYYEIRAFAQCGEDRLYSDIYKAEVNCESSSQDEKIEGLKLFPNPGLSFKLESDRHIDQVDIYSTTGKLMRTYMGGKLPHLYGENLSSGVYVVIVKSQDKRSIIRWVHNM